MTRFTRTTLLIGLVLATTLANVAQLWAGCGGGGYRRSYSYRPRPTYYAPPVCTPPPAPQSVVQPQPQPQPWLNAPAAQPSAPLQQPGTAAPQQAQPAQPQGAPTTQPGTQASTAAGGNAQMTALQALASMGAIPGPTQAPAPQTQPQAPSYVGNWTASLANGARVQLTLGADGRFNWTAANKSGQTSAFQGSYSLANGSLTLVRTNDSQKLTGTMTSSGNSGFNFKLAGTSDSGLNFVRG